MVHRPVVMIALIGGVPKFHKKKTEHFRKLDIQRRAGHKLAAMQVPTLGGHSARH